MGGWVALILAEELAQRHWRALYGCFHADITAAGVKQAILWFLRYGCLPNSPSILQNKVRQLSLVLRKPAPLRANAHFWLAATQAERLGNRIVSTAVPVRRAEQQELLNRLSLPFYAQVMERGERDAARLGLELRHPLHTPQLAQLAFATPTRFRLRGDLDKVIHRQALHDVMPANVLARKDKAEFSVAFRTRLDAMQPLLTGALPQRRPDWVDAQGMTQLYQIYQKNPQRGWPFWILWSIYLCDLIVSN